MNQYVQAKLDQMSVRKTKNRGSIGLAEWLVDRRLAVVVKSKGSYGFCEEGVRFLSPYETVSVIDSQEYEVTLKGLPLSLEEAYSVCLTDERDFDVYRVYVSLMRQGLRIKKKIPKVPVTGDVRSEIREVTKATKRDIIEVEDEEFRPEIKRYRRNNRGSVSPSNTSPDLAVSNLSLALVRHREFVVPPIHDYLKANAKDWTEYKEINCYLDQNFVGRVVDLPEGLNREVSQKLPSSILSNGMTWCINRFDAVYSLHELCKKLQERGPKTYSCPRDSDSFSKVSLHFKTDEDEDGNVVVVHADDPLPSPRQVHDLSRDAILIVAVIDESLITLFRFTSVSDWQEMPSLWLQHVD